MFHTLTIETRQNNEMILITQLIRDLVRNSEVKEGLVTLFVPHTTAGITINENADPDVKRDILHGLSQAIPNLKEFRHFEGNSDAHIKSSLVGVDQTINFHEGYLVRGPWHGIYFCEFDGPRRRNLVIHIQGK